MNQSRHIWRYAIVATALLILIILVLIKEEKGATVQTAEDMLTSILPSNELLPDLSPLPPFDVTLSREGGRLLLRFSTAYYNHGRGPLELRADPATAGIKDDIERDVLQRIYLKDGTYEESSVGTFLWHEEHLHYHFDDFIEYDLTPVHAPARAQRADGPERDDLEGAHTKATFCIRDVSNVKLELKKRAEEAEYRICGKEIQGISVGWADTYFYDYPDQSLDITGLESGTYRLTFTANPERLFRESRYRNNVSWTLFALDMETQEIDVLETYPASPPEIEHVHLEQPFGLPAATSTAQAGIGAPSSPEPASTTPNMATSTATTTIISTSTKEHSHDEHEHE